MLFTPTPPSSSSSSSIRKSWNLIHTFSILLDNYVKSLSLYENMFISYDLVRMFSCWTSFSNIVLDKNGKIIFLTRLFDKKEFEEMISVIENELKS